MNGSLGTGMNNEMIFFPLAELNPNIRSMRDYLNMRINLAHNSHNVCFHKAASGMYVASL